jgi:uncharacterized membrane protein YfcA
MTADYWTYGAAAVAVVLTGLAKGGFLGGLGGLAVPILSLVMSPVQAAGIMLPILIAMDWIGLWAYRREWDGRNLAILLPSALIGIAVAYVMAARVTDAHVRLIVGVVALVFCLDYWLPLRAQAAPRPASFARGSFWGAVAGFTSFVSHAGGPPLSVYLLPQRMPNATYAATAVAFFTIVNLVKVPAYASLGQLGADNLTIAAGLMPLAVVSILAGVRLTRVLPQEPFYRLAYGCLLLVSLKLIWDGARALA